MPSYVPPEKNATFVFYVSLVSQASRPQFQANPTLVAGDVLIATDDGAPANLTTLPEVDADFTKRVKVTVATTEMNGDNTTIIFSDVADAEWDDQAIFIQTSGNQIDDLATSGSVSALNALLTGGNGLATIHSEVDDIFDDVGDANTALTNIQTRIPAALVSGRIDAAVGWMATGTITAAVVADGAIDAATFAAGAITAAGIATGAIDADAIAADAITAAKIADGAIDAATFATGAITAAGIATGAIDADALAHDAVEEISEDVWDHSHRTLTTSAAALAAAVLGSTITLKRGDTLSAAITGLGSLAGRTKFWFTVKADDGEPDTAALILIRETDGLIYLNGAAAVAGQGSLVVVSVPLGNVTVTLAAASTATLLDGDYTYDFQILTPTGVTTLSEGTFTVTADITRAIA